jgi:hypothetical protein
MQLRKREIPLACALADEAASMPGERSLPCQFVCAWAAFENIYTALARQAGLLPQFELRRNGTMQTTRVGKLKIVLTRAPSAQAQIVAAVAACPSSLKHWLIAHPSTRFFVTRTPTLHGQPLTRDAWGQQPNGVVSVARTADARYPAWSPIDTPSYQRYMAQPMENKAQDELVTQLVALLGTVRENLACGGERDDEESGEQVVAHALTLLVGIVSHFTGGHDSLPRARSRTL